MKRTLSFFVLSLAMALPLVAQGLGELFQKAKEQVKTVHWVDALKTLDALDGASRAPGLEPQRKQLEPALAFYRGVCLANTDRPADAQTQFETYLAVSPNASLDRAMYSKKAVDAFEKAQKKMSGQGESASGAYSLAASYRDFRMTEGATMEPPKENWTEGPVKVLLTPEEKREWAGLSDAVSRSEFVTKFWTARDQRPETPENECRQDFEKRVAFADKYFVQDETRGSLTDRGSVFLLLGPPTYAGRSPIGTGDDTSDSQGLSSVGRHDAELAVAEARGSSGRLSTGQDERDRRPVQRRGDFGERRLRQLARGLALPAGGTTRGSRLPAGGFRFHQPKGLREECPPARSGRAVDTGRRSAEAESRRQDLLKRKS
ncbi:MAG TPA: GWxTD domain-containing protein, partial [Thermoanaerobaculia bacterium]